MRKLYFNMGEEHHNVSEKQIWKWRCEHIACVLFILTALFSPQIIGLCKKEYMITLQICLVEIGGLCFLALGYGIFYLWEHLWNINSHDDSNDFIYGPGDYSDDQ